MRCSAASKNDERCTGDGYRTSTSLTLIVRTSFGSKPVSPCLRASRHWIITDANGKVQEVSGDGVVGEQPHLNPGEEFRYSSGAVLETPVGAMQGLYRMEADNGVNFDAPIAPFTLAVPGVLH